MFTPFSLSSTPVRSAKRHSRKLTAKSSLGVEALDSRKMLAFLGGYYPMTSSPYLSMPTYTSTYSTPSSYAMPTYGNSSVNAYSSARVSYPPNPYAASSPARVSVAPTTSYSTGNFYGMSCYVTPTYSAYGMSSYSTPLSSSYFSGNPSSHSYNTYSSSPYSYNTYNSSSYGSNAYTNNSFSAIMASNAQLNAANTSNLLSLQAKSFEVQRLGGVVPSTVSSLLNSYSDGSSSLGAATQTGYTRAQIASMTSAQTQYSMKPYSGSTFSTSYKPYDSAYNKMLTDSMSYFTNVMQTTTRTMNAINQLVSIPSAAYRWSTSYLW